MLSAPTRSPRVTVPDTGVARVATRSLCAAAMLVEQISRRAAVATVMLNAAIFFDHVDALVAWRICTFLDAASLLAVSLAIRSLQEQACSQLQIKVVHELQSSAPKRKLSVQRLSRLGDPRLSQHAATLVLVLQESQLAALRNAVLKTLGRLGAASLAQHTPQVIQALDDSSAGVRTVALATLGKLEASSFAQYTPDVVSMLEDSNPGVVCAALKTLGKLDAAAIEEHASCPTHAGIHVARQLLSEDSAVRRAALKTLGRFGSTSPIHVFHVAMGMRQQAVDDTGESELLHVRGCAVVTECFGEPSSEMFAQHAATPAAVMKRLEAFVIDGYADEPAVRVFVCCFVIATLMKR